MSTQAKRGRGRPSKKQETAVLAQSEKIPLVDSVVSDSADENGGDSKSEAGDGPEVSKKARGMTKGTTSKKVEATAVATKLEKTPSGKPRGRPAAKKAKESGSNSQEDSDIEVEDNKRRVGNEEVEQTQESGAEGNESSDTEAGEGPEVSKKARGRPKGSTGKKVKAAAAPSNLEKTPSGKPRGRPSKKAKVTGSNSQEDSDVEVEADKPRSEEVETEQDSHSGVEVAESSDTGDLAVKVKKRGKAGKADAVKMAVAVPVPGGPVGEGGVVGNIAQVEVGAETGGAGEQTKRKGRPPKKNIVETVEDEGSQRKDDIVEDCDTVSGEEDALIKKKVRNPKVGKESDGGPKVLTPGRGRGRPAKVVEDTVGGDGTEAVEAAGKPGKGRGRPPKKVTEVGGEKVGISPIEHDEEGVEDNVVKEKSGKGRGRPSKGVNSKEKEVTDDILDDETKTITVEGVKGKGRGRPAKAAKTEEGEPPKKRGRKPKAGGEMSEGELDVGA